MNRTIAQYWKLPHDKRKNIEYKCTRYRNIRENNEISNNTHKPLTGCIDVN